MRGAIVEGIGGEPAPDEVRETVLAPDAGPERLDRALAGAWPDLSRSRLQALVREGRVRVDGAPVRDPSAKMRGGAALTLAVPPAQPPEPLAEAIPLLVVHEDGDVVVIDKPAGLVVHPAAGHETGTLVNALIAHCGMSLSGIGGVRRPGIVHRLDKDTSGLLVVAKNDAAHQSLSAQFADHGRSGPLVRQYLALAWGTLGPAARTIDAPLARSSRNREKMAVAAPGEGRRAVTHVTSEAVFQGRDGAPVASLVRCTLETGRTHQIRVHMAEIGHPLLGDALYGAGFKTKAERLSGEARARLAALGRQALHAAVLGFEHPGTGEALRFESPLPADMAGLVAALRAMG